VGKGTEMGSVDSIDCQEGSREIPICQVGRDEQLRLCESLINSEVSLDQPEELTEQVSSEMDLNQQMKLTEEDLRSFLMIGGIEIFLPFSQEEAEVCVVDAATAEAGQPAETVREALEQTLEAAQEEEENEHSEEWLNAFSQKAEKKEAAALKPATEEAEEQAGRLITPWEMELKMLEDWLNNPERQENW
jgi:hypothetical protein